MNEIYFQSPGILKMNGIATKADGTIDGTFNFQEMTPADAAALHMMRGKFGQIAFISQETPLTDAQLDDMEVPDVSPEFKGEKSPSQRLRAVLYLIWKQGGKKTDFELFYRTRMDRIITQLKEKLD